MFHQRDLQEKSEPKCKVVPQYPQRLGEPDCRDFLRTGRCKYGDSCKYHHPIGGAKISSDPSEPPFPIRPNEPPCQYFLKHGTCKFGQTCKFHHPPHLIGTGVAGLPGSVVMAIPTIPPGSFMTKSNSSIILNETTNNEYQQNEIHLLPQRLGEPDCIYFLRNGRCKYGSTCKYHHPIHRIEVSSTGRHSSSQYHQYPSTHARGRSISTGSMIDMKQMQHLMPGSGQLFTQNTQPTGTVCDKDDRKVKPLHQTYPVEHSPPNSIPKFGENTLHHYGEKQMKSTILNGFYHNGQRTEDIPLSSGTNNISFTNHHPSPDASPSMGSTAIMSASASASSYETATSSDFQPGSPTQLHNVQRGSNYRQYPQQPTDANVAWNQNYQNAPQYLEINNVEQEYLSKPSLVPQGKSSPQEKRAGSNEKYFANNIRNRSNSLNQYIQRPRTNLPQSGTQSLNNSSHLNRGWSSNISISTLSQTNEQTWESKSNFAEVNIQGRHGVKQPPPRDVSANMSRNDSSPKEDVSTIDSKTQNSQLQNGNFDDGLSMMTSALLTMLDSPAETPSEIEKERNGKSEEEVNQDSSMNNASDRKEVLKEAFNEPSNMLNRPYENITQQHRLDDRMTRKVYEHHTPGNEKSIFHHPSSFPS